MADTFTNFSGNWSGVCEVNGKPTPSTKVIEQQDKTAIHINGMKFDLEKPTVVTLDDVDDGKKYRQVTVYDWSWSTDGQVINTSAKWVGWYLDGPGSWSGDGLGVIKFDGDNLMTTRKFGTTDEVCIYPRPSAFSTSDPK